MLLLQLKDEQRTHLQIMRKLNEKLSNIVGMEKLKEQ